MEPAHRDVPARPSRRRRLVSAGLTLLVAFAATACSDGPSEPADPPDTPSGLTRGVALSPAGFPADFSQLNAFLDEVASFGRGAVMWNGAWRDDVVNGTNAGTVPVAARLVAENSAGGSRFAPIAVFGWRSGQTLYIAVPANATNDWGNAEARVAFRAAVSSYAATHRPALLFLGNESDFYAEQDPADYQRWVAAYNEAYDAIKAASPQTRVGPVFNVEHMMGLGTFSGWTTPHPEAYTLHDANRIDVVGLTLYPYLGLAAPADVPASYLDPVFALIGSKPIAITETGWPASSSGSAVAWQPGEAEQVAWLARLDAMLATRSVLLVNWLFLHPMASGDQGTLATFGSVSLRTAAGAKRPVYDAFLSFGAERSSGLGATAMAATRR